MSQKTLYWLTHDLRLTDNPALIEACNAEQLLCVYCVEPQWFSPLRYQTAQMGTHRWVFLQETLSELNQALMAQGSHLLMRYGRPNQELGRLIDQHRIDRLVVSRLFGSDERASLSSLQAAYPALEIVEVDTATVFSQAEFEALGVTLPASYSKFRRKAEKADIAQPLAIPPFPKPVAHLQSVLDLPSWLPKPAGSGSPFVGGERAAQQHLKQYFREPIAHEYKARRNELQGWDNSSKLSPWLNVGSLSARQVYAAIRQFESEHGDNEGTHWLWVEILWREFFQWLSLLQGHTLFRFQGLAKSAPLTTFYPSRFKAWCEGNTAYPLVNACMNELRETGYLTNRGRQIVASCLVNELSVDWRYGAAWFEHCLVDYNVGANWGNWQYIAGVGVDPRGGRHFNIDKQTDQYDPDGHYQNQWPSHQTQPVHHDALDAAGWPIGLQEVPK